MTQPLCFVLMPFGKKPDGAGGTIDFDAVYRELIAPAVIAAELDVVRADEELTGGIIHKPMFERLLLCEYAVADLTTANANVFYELRPFSTVLVFSEGMRLPFDVASLRALPYALEPSGVPADPQRHGAALTERLREARARATDSPLFHLIDGLPVPEIDRAKTDVFQQQVRAASKLKERLADARDGDLATIVAVRDELGAIADAEAELVVALFLAYRDCGAYEEMVTLVDEMSPPLAKTAMVQEQLALALNRLGDGERAERVLLDLLARRGASSETYGLLGRVYKDRWTAAKAAGRAARAAGLLQAAIDAYVKGFETDWRDAYPGRPAARGAPPGRRVRSAPARRSGCARLLGLRDAARARGRAARRGRRRRRARSRTRCSTSGLEARVDAQQPAPDGAGS